MDINFAGDYLLLDTAEDDWGVLIDLSIRLASAFPRYATVVRSVGTDRQVAAPSRIRGASVAATPSRATAPVRARVTAWRARRAQKGS